MNPNKVPHKQSANDRETYIKDCIIFLSFIISIVSNENVENVVKEPKKPIIKKYLIKDINASFWSMLLTKIPMNNDPRKLIKSVPKGNCGK